MSEQIEIRSKELLNSITEGLDFSVPNVDFNDSAFDIPDSLANALQNTPEQLTVGTLTECTVDGQGCFDRVMTALKAHLKGEYEAGRITGAEYTKAYIASIQGALQFSVQYLLGKDNAHFSSLGAQAAALRANVEAYTAKVQLAIAQAQAHQNKAIYANEVLKLGATDTQRDLVIEQSKQVIAQTSLTGVQQNLTAEQVKTQEKQTTHLVEQTEQVKAQTTHLGAQTLHVEAQKDLTLEQIKVQEKQINKVVADTNLVEAQTELSGVQKALVSEQVNTQTKQTAHLTEQTKQVIEQTKLITEQIDQTVAQTGLIGAQTNTQIQQKELLKEQTEQAHAQVSDTQLDGITPVTGYIGDQKALLKQQVVSFKKDSIIKSAKIYADSFATQLSMSSASDASGTGLDANGIGNAMSKLANSMDS